MWNLRRDQNTTAHSSALPGSLSPRKKQTINKSARNNIHTSVTNDIQVSLHQNAIRRRSLTTTYDLHVKIINR